MLAGIRAILIIPERAGGKPHPAVELAINRFAIFMPNEEKSILIREPI